LQGAQVTDCVPAGQIPLLWMSPTDPQAPDTPLCGGIPLCWPWFADARLGPVHGIARTSHWQLQAACSTEAGVQLVLQLPELESVAGQGLALEPVPGKWLPADGLQRGGQCGTRCPDHPAGTKP